MAEVTVIITPRDRYTGALECIKNLYNCTLEPFELIVLDLGYPKRLINRIRKFLQSKDNAQVISLGRIIPMEAFHRMRHEIKTPYTVLLDNDSNVTPGWLPPLLETAKTGASIISPLTLETGGLDIGASLRNHIYTSEVRVVDVEGKPYMIEYKPYRRATPDELPKETCETDIFELHGVMFNTKVFQTVELPQMVIREQIDIAMQVKTQGGKLLAEPRSVIVFDNLASRMSLGDMKFFFFRWSQSLAQASADLFEKRWNYRFYSEQGMYNWIFRRKVFLLARYLGCSIFISNKITGLMKRIFCKDWDPLSDPEEASKRLYHMVPPHEVPYYSGLVDRSKYKFIETKYPDP